MAARLDPSVYAAIGVGALLVWRFTMRVRRLVGRQRLSAVRLWLSVGLFPLLAVALLISSLSHPGRALAELLGLAIGCGLAVYGLRRTRFEVTAGGLFYTPSAHIGILLSTLMFARIVYGLGKLYLASSGFTAPPTGIVRSPITLLIVGTLAGYYASYAWGLLRWRARQAAGRSPFPQDASPGA